MKVWILGSGDMSGECMLSMSLLLWHQQRKQERRLGSKTVLAGGMRKVEGLVICILKSMKYRSK